MTTNNSASGDSVTTVVQAGIITGGVTVRQGSSAPVPHNLPPSTRHFAGRRADLERLTGLADARSGSRVCVVDGAPGIGKTAFAVRWGNAVRDRFPDGQVYVDLCGFDPRRTPAAPEAAIRMILGALHVPAHSIPPDADGQSAYFRSLLAEREVLLILDNVRDSDQVRSLLPGSSRCFTVVTARHRLDGLLLHHGAEGLTLAPFTAEEAVELLEGWIGDARVDAERAAVDRVVAACGGHPLALSVVAARAATDAASPLQALVDELEDKNVALDALRLTDAADFRAVFALSYDHLPARLAGAFRDLALHTGTGFDVASVAAVTGADLPGAARIAGELTRRHLVDRVGSGRYAFHALTHAYGVEKSSLTDGPQRRLATVRAWLNHQLHAANRADRLINAHRRPLGVEPCERPDLLPPLGDRVGALAWFTAEYDNVLAAIATAVEERLDPYIWQLPWVMSNFAYLSARWPDWVATHEVAVEAARRSGDRQVEARLRQSLARAHCESGAYQRSIDGYLAALDLLDDRLATAVSRANALNGLSGVRLRSGAHEKAIETGLRALRIYESLADDAGTASTYSLLGRASLACGRSADAARYHHLARALYEWSGNLYGLAHVADRLAELDLAAGDHGQAEQHLREAIRLHYVVGNRHYAVTSCRALRDLLLPLGRETGWLDEAIAFLDGDLGATVGEFTARLGERRG